MRKFRVYITSFLATLLVVFVAGCGQETVSIPGVLSVTPVQGATSVALNATISATFSQTMSAASINATTFTLADSSGAAVAGTVAYSTTGSVATFTPTSGTLAYGTTYTATITNGATTPGGSKLIDNYVWSFTTISASVPSVLSVTPLAFASNVAVSAAISATFSQAMSAATINGTTFTVAAPGGVAVTGTVTLNTAGTAATFVPTSGTLTNDTTYTATITTGAKSTASIPLASNYVWSFTTISASVPSVLSVTPLAFASNVAVSATISATFSQAMSAATISDTTFTVAAPGGVAVTGTVTLNSAGTVATFVPTSSTLANSTTYTATITTGAQSTTGIPLVANYVWTFTTITPPPTVVSTTPRNTATGVSITQVLTARFNEAMLCSTLQQSPATTFTLTGPGTTSVTGSVVCSGRVVTFTPGSTLAYNTVYTATISTAAQSLAGTPLAAAYVWTFSTVPAPTPRPTVISTVPINSATGVPINQALTATFSEAMDPDTINSATFLLTVTGGAAVNGVITYVTAGSVATFVPSASLAPSTNYTATITTGATGATDLAGATLAANYVWTFTTAAVPLTSAPTVTATIPLSAATNVPLNQVVSATFSEAMTPATITAISPATFTLTAQGSTTPVAGLVAYAAIGNTLMFLPSANLTASTTYTATITTAAEDLAGTPLASDYVWTFQTGTAASTTSPEIVTTVPANAATGVYLNQAVSVTFSEAMNPLTLTSSTFQLTQAGTVIPATITYDPVNFIATLTPTNPLAISTTYNATVTTGATDLAGNPLGTSGPANPWFFTTGTTTNIAPVLGPTIAAFGGFAGTAGMTNTGTLTVINGDSGTTATGFSSYTGFNDDTVLVTGNPQCVYTETGANIGLVTGTIYSPLVVPAPYACPLEGTAATIAVADEALAEANTAYTTLQGLPSTGVLAAELGNTTIYPGVYTNSSSVGITAGDLTLDAQGDSTAYWVFQIGSTLTVGESSAVRNVILKNGAKASNIYWAVGSNVPHLNAAGGGTFEGTVIAYGSAGIAVSTVGNAAITTINGRLIGLNASVTLVNTVINVPPAP